MDSTANTAIQPPVPPQASPAPAICPQCHQPVLPQYYFCPNCGKKLEDAPLPTGVWAQVWLYFFTLVLMPITCYLIYRRWKGIKYFKSQDPKTHQIGVISIALLIISIIFVIWSSWAGTIWLDKYVQSQINSITNIDTLQ